MKSNKLIKPVLVEGLYQYIDSNGKISKKTSCKYVEDFNEGYAVITKIKRVNNDVKWIFGFINEQGKVTYFLGMDILHNFSEGLALFKRDGNYGFLNKNFEEVIENKFSSANNFSEGLAPVRIGRKWGYINTAGEMVIPAKYFHANNFSEGIAVVEEDPYTNSLIDKNGNVLFKTKGLISGCLSDGLIPFHETDFSSKDTAFNSKWGYIDKYGKVIIEPKFDRAMSFSQGLASVRIDDKWGYINTKGDIVIEAKYKYASSFSEGLGKISVELDDDTVLKCKVSIFGFVNEKGEEVIPPKYYTCQDFINGYTVAEDFEYNQLIIDKNNNILCSVSKFN